jgi:hypothetical protein
MHGLLSKWIVWAEQKIDSLDPFRNGAGGLFETIGPPPEKWSDLKYVF